MQVVQSELHGLHRLSGDETNDPVLHGPQLVLLGFLYSSGLQLKQFAAVVAQVAQFESQG